MSKPRLLKNTTFGEVTHVMDKETSWNGEELVLSENGKRFLGLLREAIPEMNKKYMKIPKEMIIDGRWVYLTGGCHPVVIDLWKVGKIE